MVTPIAVRNRFAFVALSGLALACLAQSGLAETSFLIDTGPCLGMQTAPNVPAAPVQPAAPVTATTVPAPANGDAGFGLPAEPARDSEPEELRSTVAAVRQLAPNQHVVTLANGQVWRQTSPQRYGIREGQEVRIYATRWGSAYRMSVKELGVYIQVVRGE